MASRKQKSKSNGFAAVSDKLAHESLVMEERLMKLKQVLKEEQEKRETLTSWKSATRQGSSGSSARQTKKSGVPSATTTSVSHRNESAKQSATPFSTYVDQGILQPSATTEPMPNSNSSRSSESAAIPPVPSTTVHREKRFSLYQGAHDHTSAVRSDEHQMDDASHSLATGAFDEAESHQSFLEALNEWRRSRKPDSSNTSTETPSSSNTTAQTSTDTQTDEMPNRIRPLFVWKQEFLDGLKLCVQQSSADEALERKQKQMQLESSEPTTGESQ